MTYGGGSSDVRLFPGAVRGKTSVGGQKGVPQDVASCHWVLFELQVQSRISMGVVPFVLDLDPQYEYGSLCWCPFKATRKEAMTNSK